MRKIITFMSALLIAMHFNTLSAQQTKMKVWKGDSVTSSTLITEIDSVTFETEYIKDLGNGIYLITGHRFVDLGLPSGLLWAETNIGAETETDAGYYFAWGETSPKTDFSWQNYKYNKYDKDKPSTVTITKYNKDDGKTELDNTDDAAWVNWGSYCRIPTLDDVEELCLSAYTKWKYTTIQDSTGNEIAGAKVTSRINGNSIFLPMNYKARSGGFWLNSLNSETNYPQRSDIFSISYCNSIFEKESAYVDRDSGIKIRPVADRR